jgi:hypothetical protein
MEIRNLFRDIVKGVSGGTVDAMAAFRVDDSIQKRLDALADKNTEGTISVEEREEYACCAELLEIVSHLKASCAAYGRRGLDSSPS